MWTSGTSEHSNKNMVYYQIEKVIFNDQGDESLYENI